MGRILFMLVLSSFCIKLYSLPLKEESFPSGFTQLKKSQCQQSNTNCNFIESAIKHKSKLQHFVIHISSSGGGGGRGGGGGKSSSGSSSSKSGGGGSSSRPTSSGGSRKAPNSGGTTKSSFKGPPNSAATFPSNPTTYVDGRTTNNGRYYSSGAINGKQMDFSTVVGLGATVASLLYVAFGHS